MPEKERLQWIDYLSRQQSETKTVETQLLQKITLQLHVLTTVVKTINPFNTWKPPPIDIEEFYPSGKKYKLKDVEKCFLTMTEKEFIQHKKDLSKQMGATIASSIKKKE